MNWERKRSETISCAYSLGVFTIISGGVGITGGVTCRCVMYFHILVHRSA